jgi:hypothetical protein|uniref:Uncharacterized protein n=1 Tax=Podoviridae sp. cty0j11 TaxID=2826592 RepID=A0A8S5MCP9_9CAUD|nr:MAG TPA: hypothetical protein [Podoviridae sp. cty0j11]
MIKQLKIIRAINTELNRLERQRNVYLNLLCEDISGDTEEFILASVMEINEDIVYLEEILKEEVLNGNEDNS